MTIRLQIPNMTCGHCERTVRGAVTSIDPTAKVDVDLSARTVLIETRADASRISQVLADAGYAAAKAA